MSELLSKVAEILKAPEELVQRSAEARAEASGKSVDEVLQSWAGGEAIESSAPAEATTEEEVVEATTEEAITEEEVVEATTEEVVEEEPVEMEKESSFAFIAGVISVAIFTYIFAFSIPKQQSETLVADSLNNSFEITNEALKGAEVYNQLNCQSCHTQNVRVLIPDSQNGIVLKNKYADKAVILNTGLVRIGPDLSNSASREPTNNSQWLSRYLKDSSSVRDTIPHPSYDFLTQEDFDSLITYLLSLGGSDE